MATKKSTGKISSSTASKSYNQKTIAKMQARDAGKSSSSSSKSSPVIQAVGGSRETQLANANAQMAKIQSMLAEPSTKLTSAQSSSISSQLGQASTALASLPKANAPTSPVGINPQVGETTVPTTTPAVAPVAGAVAGVAGLGVENKKMSDFAKQESDARLKAEEARQKESATLMDKFLGKVTSPTEAKTQAWDETGMDVQKYFAKQEAGIKEIESLTNEYNAVTAARDQQIAQTNDAMGSMNFINNQTAQIERNAAPKLNVLSADINAKAATLQAQQGNYAEARAYVNDAVQAATADAKFQFDMFQSFYEVNQDNFDRVDSIYNESFKTQMGLAQQEYETQLAEKQLIGEYMLKNPTAGIRMTDTIEEASRKIGLVPTGGEGLTADMKNYNAAVTTGYTGTFADFLGKGGSTSKIDGLALSLFTGEIGIGDVPSDLRNDVLTRYHEMQLLDKANQTQGEATAPSGSTTLYTAPSGSGSTAAYRVPVSNVPNQTGTTYNGPATTTSTATWGLLFQ